jgi:beta-glucosidase
MGSDIYPLSLAGAVRYAYRAAGVPVLVTEHRLGHHDDTYRAAFVGPALSTAYLSEAAQQESSVVVRAQRA